MGEILVVSHRVQLPGEMPSDDPLGASFHRHVLSHVIPETAYLAHGAEVSYSSIGRGHEVWRRLPRDVGPGRGVEAMRYHVPERWDTETAQRVGNTIVDVATRYREGISHRISDRLLPLLPVFYIPTPHAEK